jgi:hypothetical protein
LKNVQRAEGSQFSRLSKGEAQRSIRTFYEAVKFHAAGVDGDPEE